MKLILEHLFWICNGNRICWSFWHILAFNIVLENPLVNSIYLALNFASRHSRSRANQFCDLFGCPSKYYFGFLWTLLSLFFQNHVLDKTTFEKEMFSGAVIFFFLFNPFGMFCGSFGFFLHIWINLLVNCFLSLN